MKRKSVFWITVLSLALLVASIAGAQKAPRRGQMEPGYQSLAGILKMSPEDFRAARRSGKTIQEIAKEKGLTVEQLQEQFLSMRKAQVQQLVKEGKITQEQADFCLQNMGNRQRWDGSQGPKGGRGQRGGAGMCYGQGRNNR